MQKTSIPAKFLVPWAQNDTAKVEVPVTTTDPTRASQSLGFPPLTEQPPEVGGVPPQGEDFNGGMNQIARTIWWMLQGGGFPYDSAFANASQIGGYINSAVIPRADGAGYWLSTADNNTTNPDATDGTAANWVPLGVYGTAAISVSSTDVTVYPVQAAFQTLLLSGTLTANRNVILPAWTYEWKIIDNTVRGGFTLTVKTATGSGVAISTGSQLVRGDGTNIVQNPQSIAQATAPTQAVRFDQLNTLPGGIMSAAAAFASNAMTVTYNGGTLDFPSTTQNGVPSRVIVNANSITAPSGASLGAVNGQPAQIALLEAYDGGAPVPCLVNLAGGFDLSETNLITPTVISASATSATTVYSASTVSANSPYRVIAVVNVPAQTTAGVYATGTPSVFGLGGMAFAAMQSLGFGQSPTDVTASRALNTIYYNTGNRPRAVGVNVTSSSTSSLTIGLNGVNLNYGTIPAGGSATAFFIVPPGVRYSASGGTGLGQWFELS